MTIIPASSPAPNTPPVHKDVSPRDSTILGFGFALELGYTIAIPAVVFGLGGGYLDRHVFDSSPVFTLIGLFLAFASSFLVILRKVKVILARMPKTLPKKKKDPVDPEVARHQETIHDLFRPPNE